MTIRPEDVLPDDRDHAELHGITVRKGSVAAFVANAKLLDVLPHGSPERAQALAQLQALAPSVAAVGLLDVFQPRSSEIEEVFTATSV